MKAQDYKKVIEFWEKKPATYAGVLDGHIECHSEDINTSASLFNRFKHHLP